MNWDETIQLISDFFKDAWDCELTKEPIMSWKYGRPENPPDFNTVNAWFANLTFPALAIYDLSRQARCWFFMKTGDDKYL